MKIENSKIVEDCLTAVFVGGPLYGRAVRAGVLPEEWPALNGPGEINALKSAYVGMTLYRRMELEDGLFVYAPLGMHRDEVIKELVEGYRV